MDGMKMLLKSFGLDPDELKKTANEWMQSAQTTINYFVKRHDANDAMLARIEAKLDQVLSEKFDHIAFDHYEPSAMRRWTNGDEANGKPN